MVGLTVAAVLRQKILMEESLMNTVREFFRSLDRSVVNPLFLRLLISLLVSLSIPSFGQESSESGDSRRSESGRPGSPEESQWQSAMSFAPPTGARPGRR